MLYADGACNAAICVDERGVNVDASAHVQLAAEFVSKPQAVAAPEARQMLALEQIQITAGITISYTVTLSQGGAGGRPGFLIL